MLTHHAYLVEGPMTEFDSVAAAARQMLGFSAAATSDVVERQFEKFGIDDARELTELASLRSVGARSLMILGIASITTEAQQAMLKLFEEPREGLTFVILMPHGVILPTLRSRLMELPRLTNNLQLTTNNSAKIFLKSSPKERSDMLTKLLKDDDAKEAFRLLLNDIESHLYTGNVEKNKDALEEIQIMRPYLADRSPSLKMIGEHLAAVLPKV